VRWRGFQPQCTPILRPGARRCSDQPQHTVIGGLAPDLRLHPRCPQPYLMGQSGSLLLSRHRGISVRPYQPKTRTTCHHRSPGHDRDEWGGNEAIPRGARQTVVRLPPITGGGHRILGLTVEEFATAPKQDGAPSM
jgi:hypothetical protein